MDRRQLRVYPTTEFDQTVASVPKMRICLGELLPLVSTAQRMHLAWLKDFLDDEVLVSSDLFEVLQAFRSYRPSA